MAQWSLLPDALVDYVAGFLCVANQATMAAVCKPWREAMADGLCRRRPAPSIWFLLRHYVEERNSGYCIDFSCFSEKTPRIYSFPVSSEKVRLVGASGGWLMMENEYSRLEAFQPATKTRMAFPPCCCPSRHGYQAIQKAVSVPQREGHRGDGGSQAIVAVLRRSLHLGKTQSVLAFAAVGDNVWTELHVPRGTFYQDITAHDGKLYALSGRSVVLVFDIRGEKPCNSPTTVMGSMGTLVERNFLPMSTGHIGVIAGEPVLVQWRISGPWHFHQRPLPEFEVFRLQNQSEWTKVSNLSGHAILHSSHGIIAVPVGEFSELQADCIYSVHGERRKEDALLTVTNIATGDVSVEPITIYSFSMITWFLPNPEI